MNRTYHHRFDVDHITLGIDSRPAHPANDFAVAHLQLQMETEHRRDDDDDYQYAYVNFDRREEVVELIEALKLGCLEVFPELDRKAERDIQLQLGVFAEEAAIRDRELSRHRESVQLLRDRVNAAQERLKVVEKAADRLYLATLHAIHNTTDEAVRAGLVNEVAGYDFARRDLGSFSYADPLEVES